MTTRQNHEPRVWGLLGVLMIAGVMVPPGMSRPQALRVSEELEVQDHRWEPSTEEETLRRISHRFRESSGVQGAVMEVLKGLPEDDLRVLERALAPDDELPHGDMPAEDVVEDSPQELQVDDGGELAGYRGELLVLDNVNSSIPYNNSEVEEPLHPQLQKINREKLKEMRLANIKNQIMNILWPEGTPPSFSSNITMPQQPRLHQQDLLRAIADKMRPLKNPFTPGDVYTEKIQSFYPSCEIPRNTDAELWNDNRIMNLLFDLSYPSPSPMQGTQVNIVAAKLRLYKLSQGNISLVPESCPPSEQEDSPQDSDLPFPPSRQFPSFAEDKMIRVSVYWYTRSLKKHRVKRKLLDSQMLSVYGEAWTEWNIRGAVKVWRDNGRNFGLAVEVEDEDGTVLPTDKYFAPMNCSQEASTSRPIPGFLVARAGFLSNSTNHTWGASLPLDTLLFPMIDLCTIEFPESERPDAIIYHKADVSEQKKTPKTPQRELLARPSNETEKHKIRHHGHRMAESHREQPHRHLETVRRDDGDSIEEITWADDLDGHQLRKQIIVQKVIRKNMNNQQDNER
ncbi:uncharacterized protein LOC128988915 isoform X2 [Macrosteles quadrilineatus]|uniref:uncharacterized protein LOC128988915 isoform X2 n=1 Tax=Macrosteles quadrilineatus TaxID=74068 RepID=UPI0023E2EB8D|nr:uncharacterized protein LOC128988915 isoform X2 [Macrosteles quadrilineatus]